MTYTLGWLILAFVAGAFAMLVLVVLFSAFTVGRNYDAHMLPVHDDDPDDDWGSLEDEFAAWEQLSDEAWQAVLGDDVEAAYMQDELLVGQRVER